MIFVVIASFLPCRLGRRSAVVQDTRLLPRPVGHICGAAGAALEVSRAGTRAETEEDENSRG
jgi:hypothetical protein